MKIVPGAGPVNAKVLVVGEAPGAEEEREGVPFVGLSGRKLEEWLAIGGLTRADVRIENVVGVRPPNNKLERLGLTTVQGWAEDLQRRVAQLDANVIVAVGNLALNALRYGAEGIKPRKQKGQEIITYRDGITKWRGSELAVPIDGRNRKVIPTIHPAAILRSPSWEKRCRVDWQRIGREKDSPRVVSSKFRHLTRPTFAQVEEWLSDLESAPAFTYDIETYKSILCIGFARSDRPLESMTVPTTVQFWGKRMPEVWALINRALKSPPEKVTQNGLYDNYWLKRVCRLTPTNWVWDTMGMHHTIDPLEDHDLAFMSSIYAPHYCYWKDEAKDEESIRKYTSDAEALWTYNGMDVCRQIELYSILRGHVDEAVYRRHHADIHLPLLRISTHGIAGDDAIRRRKLVGCTRKILKVEAELEAAAGTKLHAKKALSPKKLHTYFYGTLGLKPIRGKANTDEVTVRRLTLKYPQKMGVVGPLILEHRRQSALSKFFTEQRFDEDGRYRSSYSPTADSARMKSKKNPMGGGSNGQNTDREARDPFIADPGCLLVEFDLSQIEDRIVKFLTGSPRLMELARRAPWEGDIHRETAAVIFNVGVGEVTKAQRYLGKRTRHAKNYGMGPETFSDQLLKDGTVLTPEECRRYLEALEAMEPEVLEWQREVRSKLMYERRLEASCGFTWHFDHHRLNHETYKSAYSLVPQHEAVCILNSNGLVPLDAWLMKWKAGRINVHAHDALLASVKPEWIPEYAAVAWKLLTQPRVINGHEMPVFVECKIGKSWGKMPVGWDREPGVDEVKEAIRGLA